jgi:acetylornithine deacetylase/succinyl-diaminopimelate desuccinylase-like protein
MGVDEDDERAHGRDERIRVEAYYKGVAFTVKLLKAVGSD